MDGSGQSDVAARSVADEIAAAGGQAITNADDVSEVSGARRLIAQALDAFGPVDALVSNAGILRDRTFLNTSG